MASPTDERRRWAGPARPGFGSGAGDQAWLDTDVTKLERVLSVECSAVLSGSVMCDDPSMCRARIWTISSSCE